MIEESGVDRSIDLSLERRSRKNEDRKQRKAIRKEPLRSAKSDASY